MDQHDCPFCRLERNRVLLESEFAVALSDGFPVAQGHTLVTPKRHVARLFELPASEQAAVCALVAQVRALLLGHVQNRPLRPTDLPPGLPGVKLLEAAAVVYGYVGSPR